MLKEIKMAPITVQGLKDSYAVNLVSFNVLEGESREEKIVELLRILSEHEIVVIGNVVIKSEAYDAFRIV